MTASVTGHLIEEYDNLLLGWFLVETEWKKFESPENRKTIRKRFLQYLPSLTAIRRAFTELIDEKKLTRTDGGNAETDATAAKQKEEARAKRAAQRPLTVEEGRLFAAMSPQQVEQSFRSDVFFRARYKVAAKQWGFKLPAGSI